MNSVVIGHALLKMPSMDVQAIPYWLRVHFAYIWSDSTEGVCTHARQEPRDRETEDRIWLRGHDRDGGTIWVSPQTAGAIDDRGLLHRLGPRFGEHRDRRAACSPGKNALQDIRP
jgi:hypothetical protein